MVPFGEGPVIFTERKSLLHNGDQDIAGRLRCCLFATFSDIR
jgi:hypothetical protein